jgi:hypothetical protein
MRVLSIASSPLLLCLACALPAVHAQQSPASPVPPNTVAQAGDAQCVLAGRLNSEGRWAPQASGMRLLDASGKPVAGAEQASLAAVKAVRVTKPALLSKCNAGQTIASGDASAGSKSPAPAVTAGSAPIEAQVMATLPGRAGSQWVELRVNVPAERVVLLTR